MEQFDSWLGILSNNPWSSVIASVVLVFSYSWLVKRRLRYPPGPRRLPFIGSVLHMPKNLPWLTFSEWSKTYGDIVYLEAIGQSVVVINSAKVAKDLLEKRSSIYSDRPKLEMCSLSGYARAFVLEPYGEEWRQQRKIVAHDFSPANCPCYYGLQDKAAQMLVSNVLQSPDAFVSEIKHRIGAIILRTVYGYKVESVNDARLKAALTATHGFSKSSTPGAFLVDFIPWLKYVPGWVPGAGFQGIAKKNWNDMDRAGYGPVQFCKDNLWNDKMLMPNLCGRVLQEADGLLSPEAEERLVWAAGTVFGGGLDTNMSTVLTFFMAMILNPHVQKNAQVEIDLIIGKERLPCLEDKQDLPYIRSIVTEVLRWGPAAPLGIPHSLTQDDVYNGIFIPKGSSIISNIWHMLHDPATYDNPMKFMPERYNGRDDEMEKVKDLVFGFGRRVCPGRHFAEGTVFAIVVTTLATCDVLLGLNEDGEEVLPKYAYTSGMMSFPEPFVMRLRARSTKALSLLSESCD